jgi:hypothetical protein
MATIASNGSGGGASNATGSWAGGAIPVDGDKVNIVSGDTITMTGTHTWGDDTSTCINVKSGGIIKANRSATSSLICKGEMVIEAGGELDYGKAGDVISASYTHKIRLNFSASMADGKWGFKTLIHGSKFHMHGSVKTTNTGLTTRLAASGTSFVVTDATGWAVGDIVVLGTTSPGDTKAEIEERVINSVSTNTIGISVGATNVHEIGCRISNFTKNVGFEAHTDANESYTWFDESATGNAGDKTISHAQFRYMGDDGSSNEYGAFRIDGNGTNHVAWTTMTDVTIYKGQYAAVDLYTFSSGLVTPKTMSNFAIYNTVNHGVYFRSTSGGNFNNWHIFNMHNYSLLSGWGNGMVNAYWNDCWFIGGNYGLQATEGWNIVFTRCKFSSIYRTIITSNCKQLKFIDCDIGYELNSYDGSGVYSFYMYLYGCTDVLFTNCNFNYTTSLSYMSTSGEAQKLNKFYIERKDGDWNSNEIHTSEGSLHKNSGGRTAAFSLLAKPNASATAETLDYEWYIPAPSGVAVTVTGYMMKNSSYGSSTRPSMTFSGMGITPVTVTMTDVADTWYAFSVAATQSTGASGVLTLTWATQSANSGATATLSDVTHSMPASDIDTGDMLWWHDGRPIQAIMQNNQEPIVNANVKQWLGSAVQAAQTGFPAVDVKYWDTTAIPTPTNTGIPDVNVSQWKGTDVITPSTAGTPKVDIDRIRGGSTAPETFKKSLDNAAVNYNADSGTTTTLVDSALTQADDHWNGAMLVFSSGTNIGRSAIVTDFVAATDTLTLAPPLPNAITTEQYVLIPGLGHANVEAWKGDAVFNSSTAGVPDVNATQIGSNAAAASIFSRWMRQGINWGATDSGTTTTITDAALTEADDHWNGSLLIVHQGTNVGKTAIVVDFVAATDTLTFTPAMPAAIDATSIYSLVPGHGISNVEAWSGTEVQDYLTKQLFMAMQKG